MTLPASGPISMAMVAAELNTALPLSLQDSRVRTLAGKPTGPISLGDLRGKSAMTVTGVNSSQSYNSTSAGGTATAFPSVTVAGGVAPYTYAWTLTATSGPVLALSQATSQTAQVSRAYSQNQSFVSTATLTCTVTDSAGTARSATGVVGTITVQSNA